MTEKISESVENRLFAQCFGSVAAQKILMMRSFMSRLMCFVLAASFAFPVNASPGRCEAHIRRSADYEALDKAARILEADMRELRDLRRIKDRGLRIEARDKIYTPKEGSTVAKAAVIANYAFSMILAYQVARGYVAEPTAILTSLLTIPAAMFSASAVSWFFHKSLDSYLSEANPIWGASTRNFRRHHEFATGHNSDTYIKHISDVARVLTPAFVAAPFLKLDPAMGAATWVFLVSLMNASEVHRQAHLGDKAGRIFKELQRRGLAITQKAHNQHHRNPFNTDFDILFGWSNRPFEALKLSERLDYLFYRWMHYFRRFPTNWIHSPESIPPEVIRQITLELKQGIDHVPRSLWVMVDHIQLMAQQRGKTADVPPEVKQIVELSKALERAKSLKENPAPSTTGDFQ